MFLWVKKIVFQNSVFVLRVGRIHSGNLTKLFHIFHHSPDTVLLNVVEMLFFRQVGMQFCFTTIKAIRKKLDTIEYKITEFRRKVQYNYLILIQVPIRSGSSISLSLYPPLFEGRTQQLANKYTWKIMKVSINAVLLLLTLFKIYKQNINIR